MNTELSGATWPSPVAARARVRPGAIEELLGLDPSRWYDVAEYNPAADRREPAEGYLWLAIADRLIQVRARHLEVVRVEGGQ